MTRETVLEARADGVLRLTLNRPAQKNAFNTVQWREARDALRDARADDAVRAVLVTGAGSAFSAGQDLGEMAQSTTAPAGGGGSHPFGEFMDELCQFDKPLVAAVNGVAVGIGLTLLAALRLRVRGRGRAAARTVRHARRRAGGGVELPACRS